MADTTDTDLIPEQKTGKGITPDGTTSSQPVNAPLDQSPDKGWGNKPNPRVEIEDDDGEP